MYLKRIEAYGFKSFAHRVAIDFDLGMNGIVGPNGSGKSNVVDAVRWVLGEQSAKMLRGGSMQDVIFKGSTLKKQLGFAEVTLVLDNTNKELPVEFEEVSVTRRLYRSGESNYLLNKQKVRLQDITNLFMDSGIGKESFSIIGQGKIDEILNSKPVERRAIFEETAGVLKYKTRKEQSLRRLDKTHENLVRVNDVIVELEKQVQPLQKQAAIAKQYLEYKEELSSTEVSLLAYEIHQFTEEIKRLGGLSDELTIEMANHVLEAEKNIQSLSELTEDIKEKDTFLQEKQELLLQITQEAESAKGAQQMQMQRKKHLESMIAQVGEDIAALEGKVEHVVALEKKSATINFEEKISVAKQNEKEIKDAMQENLQVIDGLRNQFNNKLSQLQSSKSRLETLIEINESNQNLFQGVREVIKAKKIRALSGIHGTVLDLIDVNEEYVKAIEVSFANALQFIVTDTQKDAEQAIRYLKEHRLGKATFLPLNVIKGSQIHSDQRRKIANLEGYLGIASELVHFKEEYTQIIHQLLGQTIVVDTLQHANNIAKTIGFSHRIVTLDGEIVHRGGSMTGGEGRHEKAGLLLQKQEIKSLGDLVKALESEKDTINEKLLAEMSQTQTSESKLHAAQEKTRELENQQQLFAHQLTQMLSQKDDLIMQINSFTQRKTTYVDELKTIEEVHGSLADSTDAYDEQKDAILSEINAFRKMRLTMEQEKQDLELSIKSAEQQEREIQKQLQKNELQRNTAEVKINEKIGRLQDTYTLTMDDISETHLDAPYEEINEKVMGLRKKIDQMGMVNLGAIDEYDRVSERYEYLQTQKQDLDEAELNLLEIIQEMDEEMKERFEKTFIQIQSNFEDTFKKMFGGGHAELRLEEKGEYLTSGIEIFTQPPGKKIQNLSLLSGGERALTAIALLFAILKTKPVPFCILDEVEAALDEANVDRFAKYVKSFSKDTQFIVVTHRKGTMEMADVLYGVTMEEAGISKVLSVRLQDASAYLENDA